MIFIASFTQYYNNRSSLFKNKNGIIESLFASFTLFLNYYPDINKLILINDSSYPILKNDFVKFIKSEKYKYYIQVVPPELRNNLSEILLDTKIFTEKDLHAFVLEPWNFEYFLDPEKLNICNLLDFINGEVVVTDSLYLSRFFIEIIENIPNLEILKSSFIKPPRRDNFLDKVENTRVYLNFIFMFDTYLECPIFNNLSPDINWNIPKIIDCFSGFQNLISENIPLPRSISTFYKESMKIYKGTQRKINLVGSDEYLYLINNIVEDLENKFGKFCHCDCVDGNITIDKNIKGLVIFNANKLEPSKFKEINSEIRNNKSSGKFYILQSSEPLEYLRDQTFKVIKLPAYTHICELPIMIRFLAYMIKKIFEIDDAKKIARLIINPRIVADFSLIPSLNDLVNELQELNSGNSFTFVDYNNRDFWFDYECYLREKDFTKEVAAPSINPINNGKFSSVESKEQQYNPDKTLVANEKEEPIIPIEFTHHKGEDKWEINYSENKEPIEINYKNNIGIKYLVYLAKHCSSKTNAIRADELLKIVKDWDGKVVKEREEIPTKTPEQLAAGRIKSAINTSFVNRSKKLKNRKIDPYETQNQKKLEGLNLGNDYDTKTTYSLGKDIECFYYERRSNYVIDKIIDEDNEILFPPD